MAGDECEIGIIEGDAHRTVARTITEVIDIFLKFGANRLVSMWSAGDDGGIDEKGDRPVTTFLQSLRL